MKKLIMLVLLIPSYGFAQEACITEEKPHYFVADKTLKTTMPEALKAVLTQQEQLIWTNTYRSESVVSPVHKDLAACNEALDFLKAQRAIAPKNGIHALQSVSYEGSCLAVEICP